MERKVMERRPQKDLNRVDGRLFATEVAVWFIIKQLPSELKQELSKELKEITLTIEEGLIGTKTFRDGFRNCVDLLLERG